MRKVIGAGLAAALLAALTGCGQGDSGEPHGSARTVSDEERARIEHAGQILVHRCMEAQGLPYFVSPPLPAEKLRVPGYVLDDVAWARRHGYGTRLQQELSLQQAHDPNARYRATLTGADLAHYIRTLNGGPGTPMLEVRLPAGGTIRSSVGGCQAEARERLYGDATDWFRIDKVTSNLTPLYVPQLVKDVRFTEVQSRWSVCAGKAGHPATDPPALRARVALRDAAPSARTRREEISAAVTEATCARDTGFGNAARTLEREYRDRLRPRFPQLDARDRLETRALDLADRILS